MHVLLTVQLRLASDRDPREKAAFYGEIMDELEKLDVIEPDLCAEAITVVLPEGQDLGAAICHASTAVRTAILAAGGSTPNWPHCDDLDAVEDGNGGWVVQWAGSSQRPKELIDA